MNASRSTSSPQREGSWSELDLEQRHNSEETDAGEPIFVQDGKQVKFVLHSSIKRVGAIEALARKIWRHGGDVLDTDDGVDIVLINPARPGIDQRTFQLAYDRHPDANFNKILVKEMSLVDESIQRGYLLLEPPVKKPLPGFPPGFFGRTPFTPEDRENLCQYLAIVTPERAGRLSHSLYKEMMSLPGHLDLTYEWIQRHTAQSWREHYKKNQATLDARIGDIVAEREPNPKAEYYRDRLLNTRSEKDEDSDEDEMNRKADEEEEEVETAFADQRTSNKGKRRAVETDHEDQAEAAEQDEGHIASTSRRPPAKGHLHPKRLRSRRDHLEDPGPSQTLVDIHSSPPRANANNEQTSQPPAVVEASLEPGHANKGVMEEPIVTAAQEGQIASTVAPQQTRRGLRSGAKTKPSEILPSRVTRSRSRSRSMSVDPFLAAPATSSRRRNKVLAAHIPQVLPVVREDSQELKPEHNLDPLFDSESQVQPAPTVGSQRVESESEDDKQVRELIADARQDRKRKQTVRKHAQGRPKRETTPVSGSSHSGVPYPGTRASAQKKQLVHEETFAMPFKPIPGTKAHIELVKQ